MESGQFDRRVTIWRPMLVDDPDYGPQPGWDPVPFAARVPCQLLDDLPSKNERVDGVLKIAERPARLRMRYTTGITSDMKITLHAGADVSGDIDFQIAGGPAEIGRRQWLELTVKAYSV